ncbi:STN domain-containing protein [Gluconobacter sp. Dm-62]|uniref:STN domain-containing protein n=1 Tax=Gluconobacter sp. Dm-62 TaxID=2799804 RepID=UPI001B8D974A|nr:STN domain-containing protein [Gluconobacter sp. Dm-62]MBS1101474.1 STN domain-containing protein [Gluconobacter sp. Dm-62]
MMTCVLVLNSSGMAGTVTRTRNICPIQKTNLQIRTTTLAAAVAELARKTKCPVLMDDLLLQGGSSTAVRGFYTPREALIRLLGNAELDVIETVQGLAVMPLTYRAAHRMDDASRM